LPKGPRFAYIVAFVCLAVALARPQVIGGRTRVAGKGVAIVVVLDRSGSMDTPDFPSVGGATPISRLEAARRTLAEFVRGRPDDLIGLVTFANEPDLACPPTLDQRALISAANAVRPAQAGEDGTNIGDALAWGLNAIRATSPLQKVLILLTDGQDRPAVGDPPPIGPETAAGLLNSFGVTLHTIALGRPAAQADPGGDGPQGPDFERLRGLAKLGHGRAFEASDTEALARVYQELDLLERSPIQGLVSVQYKDMFAIWAAVALWAFALGLICSWTRWRRLP
jgi:Ca-activated chloride channel family protein